MPTAKKSTKKVTKSRTKPRATKGKVMPDTVLILRTCTADMRSPSDDAKAFVWPVSGPVACDDWNPSPVCGGGLHGLLWGCGDVAHIIRRDDPSMKWLVVEVAASDVVNIDAVKFTGKVKFPRGVVVFVGARDVAARIIQERAPEPAKVNYGQASASGYRGQASASGYRGQASASGDRGQASASGYRGQASASGYRGQASASGYRGQASASGYRGQASASGYRGQASAGPTGSISLSRIVGGRPRVFTIYPGENGIKPNVYYRLKNDAGEVEEVPPLLKEG